MNESKQLDELSDEERLAADFDYSEEAVPEDVPADLLGKIKFHSADVLRLAVEAKRLIKNLLQVKAQFEHLTKTVLPELMKEAGMTYFDSNGVPIELKELVTASCP